MINELRTALEQSWGKDTAWKRKGSKGSSLNQCMVTAMVVQDYLGGDILRALGPDGDQHYWNVVNGMIVDLTSDQFGDVDMSGIYACGEVWNRRKLRYARLRARVARCLGLPGAEWPL